MGGRRSSAPLVPPCCVRASTQHDICCQNTPIFCVRLAQEPHDTQPGHQDELLLLLICSLLRTGSALRARPADFKAKLTEAFLEKFGAALEAGRLKPIVDQVRPAVASTAQDSRSAVVASTRWSHAVPGMTLDRNLYF